MNLLESYKNRLQISESVHQKSHNGAKMNATKKLMIASVLNNTSKFMNEAFNSSAATQRASLGDFKKFCLNVATVALPNLILPELMLTQPMTSISGYVTYLRYTAGTDKGGVKANETMFGSVYRHGEMNEDRVNYTAERVVETLEADATTFTPAWAPATKVELVAPDGTRTDVTPEDYDGKSAITFDAVEAGTKVAYVYDNVIVPQQNTPTSLPTLTAAMDAIDLHAHARRIAVYYSQIAAFQAKTDYGYDLADQLSTQAQGELAYEIDTEGVMMLYNGAEVDDTLKFESYDIATDAAKAYISRSQYYEQFSEIVARAKKIIYQRTQKFAPNYMVVGANVLTIMPYVKGWTAAPASAVNGPYFAGTIDGLKVYCSPSIDENRFFFGVNGSDLQTSAAVYAPYMAIVPTQLLGFADGAMSQGFSTMYDMKLLSTYTGEWAKGTAKDSKEGTHSYLLVGGEFVTTND